MRNPGFLEENLRLLKSRFPKLAEMALSCREVETGVLQARDGGACFAVRPSGGQWRAVSNPVNPVECAQRSLDVMMHRIVSGLSPAVVVGLSPGYVLDSIFGHFESRLKHSEPFRHIYVLADSPECLLCWLCAADRSRILMRPEVEFHPAHDAQLIAELCERDHDRSHLFIPVSELPEGLVTRIIQPLADLYLKREREAELWRKENDSYYKAMTDGMLLEALRGEGGRKPRLLMPTHGSSTVVQYSVRDTCEAFERLGWETRILMIGRDLPPWRIVKEINQFKPDLFIFINHLRTEDDGVHLYPQDMPFLTWVQDAMPDINNRKSAEAWNKSAEGRKRDFLVGYVEQLRAYGYEASRLFNCGMLISPKIFHPVKLTDAESGKYSCDVCFASNRSRTSEWSLENELQPYLGKAGVPASATWDMHDALWDFYRKGGSVTSYEAMRKFATSVPSFEKALLSMEVSVQDTCVQRLFWLMNDLIYRHAVLEWLDEYAESHDRFKLNIYGKGWESHPKLSRYARGVLPHGPELNLAYNGAKLCLHLNSMEGAHQRVWEILSSGAVPLSRLSLKATCGLWDGILSKSVAHCLATGSVEEDFSHGEQVALADWIAGASMCEDGGVDEVFATVSDRMEDYLLKVPSLLVERLGGAYFHDNASLLNVLGSLGRASVPAPGIGSALNGAAVGKLLKSVFSSLAEEEGRTAMPKDVSGSIFKVHPNKFTELAREYAGYGESFRAFRDGELGADAFTASYCGLPARTRRMATDAYEAFAIKGIAVPEQIDTDFKSSMSDLSCDDFDEYFRSVCVASKHWDAKEAKRSLNQYSERISCKERGLTPKVVDSLLHWGMHDAAFKALPRMLERIEGDLPEPIGNDDSAALASIARELIEHGRQGDARRCLGLLNPEMLDDASLLGAAYCHLQTGSPEISIGICKGREVDTPWGASLKALQRTLSWRIPEAMDEIERDINKSGEAAATLFYKGYLAWLSGGGRSSWEPHLLKLAGMPGTGWEPWTCACLAAFHHDEGNESEAMECYAKALEVSRGRQAWIASCELAIGSMGMDNLPRGVPASELDCPEGVVCELLTDLPQDRAKLLDKALNFRWGWMLGHGSLAKGMLLHRLPQECGQRSAVKRALLVDCGLHPDCKAGLAEMMDDDEAIESGRLAAKLAKAILPFRPEGSTRRRLLESAMLGRMRR